MTHEKSYRVVFENETLRGLTLYEASKLVATDKRGLQDVAHVKRGERAVCFFSPYHRTVVAMFQANDAERLQVSGLSWPTRAPYRRSPRRI